MASGQSLRHFNNGKPSSVSGLAAGASRGTLGLSAQEQTNNDDDCDQPGHEVVIVHARHLRRLSMTACRLWAQKYCSIGKAMCQ